MRSTYFGGCGQIVGPTGWSWLEVRMYDGTWGCSRTPSRKVWGVEKASGLCGVRPHTEYDWAAGRSSRSHTGMSYPRDARIPDRACMRKKGPHVAGTNGSRELSKTSQEGLEAGMTGCLVWCESERPRRFSEDYDTIDGRRCWLGLEFCASPRKRLCTTWSNGRLQKTGGAGTASIPAPPVTCFYTTCLTARPSGMVPRRRLPAADP